MAEHVETVPWEQFKQRLVWRQGEHVAMIGPTGVGKTTLMRELLPLRKYSIVFGTKKRDELYRKIERSGYKRVESFSEIRPWDNKILLWPRHEATITATLNKQRERFRSALDSVANQGGWSVWFDECKYMAEMLGLGRQLTFCQEQLRSNGGTNVSGAQRPVWLPRSVLANASHVYLWRTTDRDDAKRLADMGGIDSRALMREAMTLGKHEFIHVHTRGTESRMTRSEVRI